MEKVENTIENLCEYIDSKLAEGIIVDHELVKALAMLIAANASADRH